MKSWRSDICLTAALTSPHQSGPKSPSRDRKHSNISVDIQLYTTIIPLHSPTQLSNALICFPRPKSGHFKLHRRTFLGSVAKIKRPESWIHFCLGTVPSLFPSHFHSLYRGEIQKNQSSGSRMPVDRWLCAPLQADLRSDHCLRNCDGAAMCLLRHSIDQTSVFLTHTRARASRGREREPRAEIGALSQPLKGRPGMCRCEYLHQCTDSSCASRACGVVRTSLTTTMTVSAICTLTWHSKCLTNSWMRQWVWRYVAMMQEWTHKWLFVNFIWILSLSF